MEHSGEEAPRLQTEQMDSESRVHKSLGAFLRCHNLHEHVSDVDEIVLSYVVSILEDLGDSQNAEENIDVDQFTEMMDAYIPGFASINTVTICEWMFELAASLTQPQAGPSCTAEGTSPSIDASFSLEAAGGPLVPGSVAGYMESSTGAVGHQQSASGSLDSAGESGRSNSESSTEEIDEQLQLLLEMFPDTLRLEAEHCLRGADGDIDTAVQLLLHRQETDTAITEKTKTKGKKKKITNLTPDKDEKQRLVEKYSFIDVKDDKKVYKPRATKSEPKKMIRYLDSQVVNTKGNRFTEVKKDDSEEMKKTYINLKPARKYRFH